MSVFLAIGISYAFLSIAPPPPPRPEGYCGVLGWGKICPPPLSFHIGHLLGTNNNSKFGLTGRSKRGIAIMGDSVRQVALF